MGKKKRIIDPEPDLAGKCHCKACRSKLNIIPDTKPETPALEEPAS